MGLWWQVWYNFRGKLTRDSFNLYRPNQIRKGPKYSDMQQGNGGRRPGGPGPRNGGPSRRAHGPPGHRGRSGGPHGKKGGKDDQPKATKEERQAQFEDQLNRELAMHNGRIGGNTETYNEMEMDKLDQQLMAHKLLEKKKEAEKPEEAPAGEKQGLADGADAVENAEKVEEKDEGAK